MEILKNLMWLSIFIALLFGTHTLFIFITVLIGIGLVVGVIMMLVVIALMVRDIISIFNGRGK